MSTQYKVCYNLERLGNLSNEEREYIDQIYNQSLMAIIIENEIINEDIYTPSESMLDNIENQLNNLLGYSHVGLKNEANSQKLINFIKKYSQ